MPSCCLCVLSLPPAACPKGFYLKDGTTCTACASGWVSTEVNAATCSMCPADKRASHDQSLCGRYTTLSALKLKFQHQPTAMRCVLAALPCSFSLQESNSSCLFNGCHQCVVLFFLIFGYMLSPYLHKDASCQRMMLGCCCCCRCSICGFDGCVPSRKLRHRRWRMRSLSCSHCDFSRQCYQLPVLSRRHGG